VSPLSRHLDPQGETDNLTKGYVMNDIVRFQAGAVQTAADVRQHVNLIQEVMQAVMKKDTHYGVIPGCQKPSLYKPGAEVLGATFRIAPSYKIEDLSSERSIRYRVTCIGTHQTTGIVMGEGVGECSSDEEKYRWRKSVCDDEFNATPENMRREKFGKGRDGIYRVKQIRTEPADAANTILKMAAKRAQVAMTLNVTAASDIFAQDIEDLPEHLRGEEEMTGMPAAQLAGFEGEIEALKSAPEAEALWKRIVTACKETGDKSAYDSLKAKIAKKGESLKAAA
jgi:hypothetical protein